MAKTLIRNKLGNNNVIGMALPCGAQKAKAFAGRICNLWKKTNWGQWRRKWVLPHYHNWQISDRAFTLLTKISKSENEIMTALKELTINWLIFIKLSGINKRLNELEKSLIATNKKLGYLQKLKSKVDCIYNFSLRYSKIKRK